MIKRVAQYVLGIGMSGLLIMPVLVFADGFGLSETRNTAGLPTGSVEGITGSIFDTVLSLIGILFFALIIYAGVTWMLSRGNQDMAKSALNTLIAAIIGLIIVLASYGITSFIFSSVESNPNSGQTSAGKCVEFSFNSGGTCNCAATETCLEGECYSVTEFNALTDCNPSELNSAACGEGLCVQVQAR